MAKNSFSTVFNGTTDAGFRAWGQEFHDALVAVGLLQTADTGQANWTTATRPADGAATVYEIWQLNDAMQATRPLFMRIEYSMRYGPVGDPQMYITVGTGTNGSGTITGVLFARQPLHESANAGNTTTPYLSNFCAVNGAFWFAYKRGYTPQANRTTLFYFGIMRSVDDTGAPNGDGVTFYRAKDDGTGLQASQWSYLTNSAYAESKAMSMIVGGATNSLVGTSPQVYKHYTRTPRVRPNPFALTVIRNELAANTVITGLSVVGATAHDYLCLGDAAPQPAINATLGVHDLAMVWE